MNPSAARLYPQLGYGLGLRPDHFDQILEQTLQGTSQVDWFEVLTENFMGLPGCGQSPVLKKLLRLRERVPIVFHCVSINIGSTDPLDTDFLKALKELKDRVQPAWMSDHLCWTGVHGQNSHELLPLPYTLETVNHVAERIHQIQDFFGERFMIENTSSYITYPHSEMEEWEFITEIVKRTDCGLLLDINNVYVSSKNHRFDPKVFLTHLPADHVGQIHLAGHQIKPNGLIVDTHDSPVCDDVYELLEFWTHRVLAGQDRTPLKCPPKQSSETKKEQDLPREMLPLKFSPLPSIMVEWDDRLPDLATYKAQILKAKQKLQRPLRRGLQEPLQARNHEGPNG